MTVRVRSKDPRRRYGPSLDRRGCQQEDRARAQPGIRRVGRRVRYAVATIAIQGRLDVGSGGRARACASRQQSRWPSFRVRQVDRPGGLAQSSTGDLTADAPLTRRPPRGQGAGLRTAAAGGGCENGVNRRRAVRALAAAVASAVLLPTVLGCGGGSSTPTSPAPASDPPIVVALGDSLTAGPGLGQDQTFPADLQRHAVAAGYPHRIINAGVTGDTSTDIAARFNRDVVVGTRVPDPGRRRERWLAGRAGGDGSAQSDRHDRARTIAQHSCAAVRDGDAADPWLSIFDRLPSSISRPRVNLQHLADAIPAPGGHRSPGCTDLDDRVHPNARGAQIMADNMWPYLEPLLKQTMGVVTQ